MIYYYFRMTQLELLERFKDSRDYSSDFYLARDIVFIPPSRLSVKLEEEDLVSFRDPWTLSEVMALLIK